MWDSFGMLASSNSGRRWARWAAVLCCAVEAVTIASAATASSAGLAAEPVLPTANEPVPPSRFENTGLAIVNGGLLWSDDGALLLRRSHSKVRRLGPGGPFSSSATAVAALSERADEESHFEASVLPRHVTSIPDPHRLRGSGCSWWAPSGPFVVVEDDLVATGECEEVREHPEREPLFVKDLRGGRWRVLRWLPSLSGPALAAEGVLLAVGVRRSDRRMKVSILDLSSGAVKARFDAPLGRLAFASPRDLVVEAPTRPGEDEPGQPVRLGLYSIRGNRLGDLGVLTEPLISGMHIVTYEHEMLSVRDVAGNASRPVAAFNPPALRLEAFAFRWPKLVTSITTSAPLLPSEVRCDSGDYGPSNAPSISTFDLANLEPFRAAPPTVEVKPTMALTECGQAPRE
jgi:hypothetical protein